MTQNYCTFDPDDLYSTFKRLCQMSHEANCPHLSADECDGIPALVVFDSWCGIIKNDGTPICRKPLSNTGFVTATNFLEDPVRIEIVLESQEQTYLQLAKEIELRKYGDKAWKNKIAIILDLDYSYAKRKGIQPLISCEKFRFRNVQPGVKNRIYVSWRPKRYIPYNAKLPLLHAGPKISPISVFLPDKPLDPPSCDPTTEGIFDEPALPEPILSDPFSSNEANKTVLILTILQEELRSVVDHFRRYCKSTKGSLDFDYKSQVYVGQFHKNSKVMQLIVGQCLGTGNTTAGVDAMSLIGKCKDIIKSKPSLAMLVGVCAGSLTREKAQIGDIVVPNNVLDDSIYKLKKDDLDDVRRIPQLFAPGIPDSVLLRLSMGIRDDTQQWRRRIKKPDGVMNNPQVHFDPIATNNLSLEDGGKYITEFQNSINRKTIAYEMEAGGFAKACHSERVPFLIIRGISDFADDSLHEKGTFRPYAAKVAAGFALAVAKLAT